MSEEMVNSETIPMKDAYYPPIQITTTTTLPYAEVQDVYSATQTVTGGNGTQTWSLIGSVLPSGLTLNTSNGTISGTPQAPGTYSFTVNVTDSTGSSSIINSITVYPQLQTHIYLNKYYPLSYSFNATPVITGGVGSYKFTSTNLPSYLTLNSTTGAIAGTLPSTAQTISFSIIVSDALRSVTLPVSFSTATIISATYNAPGFFAVGKTYTLTPTITGGSGTQTWSITSAYPTGLSINASTGVITYTPTQPDNTYNPLLIDVKDTSGTNQISLMYLTVTPISITSNKSPALEVGVPVNYTPSISGEYGLSVSRTWSVTSGSLPAGLTLSTSSGTVSGTPTTTGTYTAVISVTDTTGSSSFTFSGTVYSQMTVSGTPVNGIANVPYTYTFTVTGGIKPILYISNLPPGLTYNSTTLTISGDPTTEGTTTPTVAYIKDSSGYAINIPFSITIIQPITITTPYLPNADLNTPYSATISLTGGSGTINYGLPAGSLPPGLTLDTTTGTVSGTPTATGNYSFSLSAYDSTGTSAVPFYMTVYPEITITGPSEILFLTGKGNTYTPVVSGGNPPYTFSLKTGTLPTGIALDTTTGIISGSSTQLSINNLVMSVTDLSKNVKTLSLTLVVYGPLALSGTAPDGEEQANYSFTPTVTGGYGAKSWSIVNGSMSSGLIIDPSTGNISGVPAVSDTFSVIVSVIDTTGSTSKTFNFNAYPPLLCNYTPYANYAAGAPFSIFPAIFGGKPTLTFSSTDLPSGLSLNPTTGEVSGTLPSKSVYINFNVSVSDTIVTTSTNVSFYTETTPDVSYHLYESEANAPVHLAPNFINATGTVTYALSSGSTLPSTLTLDPSTGVISGYYSTQGEVSTNVTATSPAGAISAPVTLVFYPALDISISINNPYILGSSFTITPIVSGGSFIYTFSTENLPSYLTLDSFTGTISGKSPLTAQTVSFNLLVNDGIRIVSNPIILAFMDPIIFSYPSTYVSTTIQNSLVPVSQGGLDNVWLIRSGTLPPGMTLNSSTGIISGIPTKTGTFSSTIAAKNNYEITSSTVTIKSSLPLLLSYSVNPLYVINLPISIVPTYSGGLGTYSFSSPTGLPTGLILDSKSGLISGTVSVEDTLSFTVQVSDGIHSTLFDVNFTIIAPLSIDYFTEGAEVFLPFSNVPEYFSSLGPLTWSITKGSLPTSLTFDPTTGTISGTPVLADSLLQVSLDISATDGTQVATTSVSFLIVSPLRQVYKDTAYFFVGFPSAYETNALNNSGSGNYSYSLSPQTPLPSNFYLYGNVIEGTPTAPDNTTILINVTDDVGASTTIHLGLIIKNSDSTNITPPHGEVGIHFSFRPFSFLANEISKIVPSVGSTPIPGLTLNNNTFSGYPTQSGTFSTEVVAYLKNGSMIYAEITFNFYDILSVSGNISPVQVGGSLFSFTPTITGGSGKYTIASQNLPSYLTLDSTTGTLSGTLPLSVQTNVVTLFVSDGFSSRSLSLIVNILLPFTFSYPSLSDYINTAITFTPTTSGGDGAVTWAISQGTLPSGLSIDSSTGVISGTVTAAITAPVTISATDLTGVHTLDVSIVIVTTLDITSTTSINGEIGIPYILKPKVYGALDQLTFSSTTLPDGLALDPTTGIISGTPTTSNLYSVTLTVTNTLETSSVSFNIVIFPTITLSTSLSPGIINQQYSQVLTLSGGYNPSLTIPKVTVPGLVFDHTTNTLSGTPTQYGEFTLSIVASDTLGGSATFSQPLFVYNVIEITPINSLPTDAGNYFSFSPTITGGYGTQTWTLQDGTLPPGTTLDPTTGIISGLLTTSGEYTFSLYVQDLTGTYVQTFTSVINSPPSITGPSDALMIIGRVQSYIPVIQYGTPPYFVLATTALPLDLTYSEINGVINGIPTDVGDTPITLVVTDSVGGVASLTTHLHLRYPLALNSTTLNLPLSTVAYYSPPFTGGYGPQTWSIVSGSLPPGLSLDLTSGIITGTPTTLGTSTLQLSVTDQTGTINTSIIFNIIENVLAISGLSDGIVNVIYNQSITVTQSNTNYQFLLYAGTMPAGLFLNPLTGTVSGIPTTPGNYSFQILVTDNESYIVLLIHMHIYESQHVGLPSQTYIDSVLNSYISEYTTIMSSTTVTNQDRTNGIILLSRIFDILLTWPTEARATLVWNLLNQFRTSSLSEPLFFINANVLTGNDQENIISTYTAYRSVILDIDAKDVVTQYGIVSGQSLIAQYLLSLIP